MLVTVAGCRPAAGPGRPGEENAMNLCDEENKKDEEYHDATEMREDASRRRARLRPTPR